MDKYLITSFRDEIANAILNSQDKLNPNKDAYIDKDEIKGIEDFFGKKISELLKPQNNQSVFNNNTTNSSENNQDTVEISNSKDNKDEDDAISTYGTAANELNSKVKTNLSLTSAGKTHNNQMESLMAQKTLKAGYTIDALNNLVLDYMREHPDVDQEHLSVKKIYYGINNSKEAILCQTFGINGNSEYNNGTKNYDNNSDNESGNSNNSNSANADICYNIDFRTLNPKEQGNWHIKGTVVAGSENSDLHGAFQYTKLFKNSGVLNFTGNIRETIKDKDNIGSFGSSLDYKNKNNKLSTGAYGMYNYSNQDNNKTSEKSAEWYGRYSKTVMLSAGIKNSDEDTYYYTKGMLEGKKNFTNSGVSINGGIGGEYGRATSEADNPSENIVKLRVKGGLSFKSKDLSADISGDVTGSRIKTYYTDDTNITKTTTASFASTVSTKHIELSATVSAITIDSDNKDRGADDKPSVTASVSVGLKNIFGKNIMPIIKYDVGNYNGTAQNVGAGVKITM